MRLAVVLTATTGFATPLFLKSKEAVQPTQSQNVIAAEALDQTRGTVAQFLALNNYTKKLYGENNHQLGGGSWEDYINKMSMFYTELLTIPDANILIGRSINTHNMCPDDERNPDTDTPRCWDEVFDEASGINHRISRNGIIHPGVNQLVDVGFGKMLWLTSDHGHLTGGPDAHNVPIPEGHWTEVLHCATDHEQANPGPDAAWFHAAPGSGVSLHVGKTLVVSESELEQAGISRPSQSQMLTAFWNDVETNLTAYLGLSYWQRQAIDTLQRTDHIEMSSVPEFHEIILKPTYLKEHEQMKFAKEGMVQCGLYPELHPCNREAGATPMQLAQSSAICAKSG